MSDDGNQHEASGAAPVPQNPGRVVVAGGRGFIGRRLIPALAAAGHSVVVLTRQPRQNTALARSVRWNPGGPDTGEWIGELAGADAVINLCGASIAGPRWSSSRKRELVASRTEPSRALVQACQQLDDPPAALLQASGVGYYGIADQEKDEQAEPGDDFLARLAVDWEAPLDEAPVRTVALRFGVVLDRGGGALAQMLLPFRLFVGGPIASGEQWLSWIHAEDMVRAVLYLMDSPIAGAVNVTAPQPLRNAEFARTAGRVLRRPALFRVPRLVMEAALGEQAMLICDGQPAVPARLQAAGFRFSYPTMEAALQDLAR